jgi:hypothetical protein
VKIRLQGISDGLGSDWFGGGGGPGQARGFKKGNNFNKTYLYLVLWDLCLLFED